MSTMLLSPLPSEHIRKFSSACEKILIPELNYSGQYANYLAPVLNRPVERLNIISGLPMSAEDIFQKVQEMFNTPDRK